MSPNLVLSLLAGTLFGCGVVLLLSRSLVRSLLGIMLMGNGVNVVFMVASGRAGKVPLVTKDQLGEVVVGPGGISDPLPQAMVLTAIVITLAMTGFVLSLVHRQWQLAETDTVENDPEDERIARMAETNDTSGSDYCDTADPHALADDVEDAQPAPMPDGDEPGELEEIER